MEDKLVDVDAAKGSVNDAQSLAIDASVKDTKLRKIVVNVPLLFDFVEQPVDLQKEAISFLQAMPGLSFEYALGLAKYNLGKGTHPALKK